MPVLYVELAAMALVFAVVGVDQYQTRNIYWNPKVHHNANAPDGWFYRVNSVFYDPSIYGRFLVVAILADRRAARPRRVGRCGLVAAALASCVTWSGCCISFSQSSFVALLVAVLARARRSSGAGRRCFARRRSSLVLVAGIAVAAAAGPARDRAITRLAG